MLAVQARREALKGWSLTTARTVVRRAVDADLAILAAHERDRRIMAEIRDPMTEEVIAERVAQSVAPWSGEENAWLLAPVTLRDDGQVIGIVAFRIEDAEAERAEIGYRLHPDWHGQGLAYEATAALVAFLFETLKLHKLSASCTVDNAASWRLMERLGMQREAHHRDHCHLGGQWRDDYVYGLLARDWRASNSQGA